MALLAYISLNHNIVVPLCTTDGVEPQFATVSFPAGSRGPLNLTIQYNVPPDDAVEPDDSFTVEATGIAVFQVGSTWQSRRLSLLTDSAVFTILNDDGQL